MVGIKYFDEVDVLDVSKPFRPEFGSGVMDLHACPV